MLANEHLKQLKERGYSQEQILTMIKRHRENTGALLADAVVAVGSDEALRNELLSGSAVARPSYQVLVDLLSWARGVLEDVQERDPLNDCECEECPECGKMPSECSGTDCAASCQCSECDGCRIRSVIAAIKDVGI